ncbi:bifunctional glycosyltransferase family 2/GtrA family protein, partial [Ruminococcaceae bacterium OttesenSCG-928-I18]|nr:bifunctional glycosyltransferase family 2/GtrA family protein [Ruminococcaceae bacterium OttesenSCG-928-I18]
MKVAAVIPALNPDDCLEDVVGQLFDAGFDRVILVDDGSGEACHALFERLQSHPGCEVLRHGQNRGKGRALKTAFSHYLENPQGCVGVVTLDADGQHSTGDVVHCAQALLDHPDSLVLGTRDFGGKQVPRRSFLGNRISRAAMFLLFSLSLHDTQTGLRGIPNHFCAQLLNTSGERYEFETNMLLEAKALGIPFLEVPIKTIYIDQNKASHYRPVLDSLRIFSLLFKFALSGLSSAVIDILLFALFNWLLGALGAGLRLLLAVGGARVISAVYNFLINRNVVFKSETGYTGAFVRYVLLCAAQMLCSYGGTYFFSAIVGLPDVAAKILIDVVLFFISFQIQRRWVFPRHGTPTTGSGVSQGR